MDSAQGLNLYDVVIAISIKMKFFIMLRALKALTLHGSCL